MTERGVAAELGPRLELEVAGKPGAWVRAGVESEGGQLMVLVGLGRLGFSKCCSVLGRVQAKPASPVRASECTQPGHDLRSLRGNGALARRAPPGDDHDAQNLPHRASARS
jgi:hypothetical protein